MANQVDLFKYSRESVLEKIRCEVYLTDIINENGFK